MKTVRIYNDDGVTWRAESSDLGGHQRNDREQSIEPMAAFKWLEMFAPGDRITILVIDV
jgi:hypothetical protein